MESNDKQIGRNIKAIRNANKNNKSDFSANIHISESLLEKIENGTRPATDKTIQLISKNTGFSFSEIKYGDLSYLEKGDLCFEEDFSFADFSKICELEALSLSIMKLLFPIVEDKNALEDTEFNTGIRIVHEKIQSGVFSSKECITAINHFIRSGKKEKCADLSAINILSCFGYLYSATVLASISKEKIKSHVKESITSLSDYLVVVNNSIDQRKMLNRKRKFLEKYNGCLTTYMRKLVESQENSDYAYYYLCLRYWFGNMDEEITLIDENQMKVFAESMFDSLWKMGNKYAKALHDYLND